MCLHGAVGTHTRNHSHVMKRTYALAASVTALAVSLTAPSAQAASGGPLDDLAPHRSTGHAPERAAESTAEGTVDVFRISGSTRITTAIAASQERWSDAGTEAAAHAVVLSRSDSYADALGGSALAGAAGAPLLLTPTAELPSAVEAEIVRLLGPATDAGPVYVLGGTSAISAAVTTRLEKDLGYTVVRLDGLDRYETSVTIAKQIAPLVPEGRPQLVFATTGLNFPDGLAAGATAGGYWGTVVLTRDASVPAPVRDYVNEMLGLDVPVIAVGGPAARATAVPWTGDIVGADRYQTAGMIADYFWAEPSTTDDDPVVIGLATGLNWPDALSGGANVAGGGPLLLTRTDALPSATAGAITGIVTSGDPSPVQWGSVFGGDEVVTLEVMDTFRALLNQ